MTCRLLFQNLISLYTRREYHCIFSFSDKTIALSDSRTICHLYFQIFLIYMFIPSHISFLWQCSSISILKQYPRIFFGHWICILVSLFSDKTLNIYQTKSLDIYRWIFCIISNITVNLLSLYFFETTFLRISCLNKTINIFFIVWHFLCI